MNVDTSETDRRIYGVDCRLCGSEERLVIPNGLGVRLGAVTPELLFPRWHFNREWDNGGLGVCPECIERIVRERK